MHAVSSPPHDDRRKTKDQLIAELELWRGGKMPPGAGASGHALDFSSAQLAGILQAADDAIISMDEENRIRVFNEGAGRIFGFEPEEVLGQSIDMLLPEEVRIIHRQHVKKFARGQETARLMGQRAAINGVRKNGERFPAEASISTIEVGGERFFTVILRDISERKRAEEELRENQRILQEVFDHIDQGISMVDEYLNIVAHNQKYIELLGFSEAFYEGDPSFEDVMRYNARRGEYGPGDVEEQVRARVEQAKRFEPHLFERTRPDGTVIEIRGVPLPGGGFVTTYTDITERKRAEEELRASQRLLQSVVDTIPHTLAIKDKQLRYIKVNKVFCDVYGLSPEDVLGKTALEIEGRAEEDRINIYDDDQVTLSGAEETIVFKHTRINKFGDKRHIENIRSKLRDENGEVEGIFALALDITERKHGEEALRESEARLRSFMDHAPFTMHLKDLDGRYTLVNRVFAQRRGLSIDEIVGKTSDQIFPKELADYIASHEREVLKTGRAVAWEHGGAFSDGSQRILLTTKFPVTDQDGRTIAVGTFSMDITERKRAEEEARKNQALLQTVFDTVPSRITMRNKALRLEMVNRAHSELLNLSPEEFLRLPDQYPLLTEEESVRHDRMYREILETGESREYERMQKLANGDERVYHSIRVPRRDAEGKIDGVVMVATDITERKRAEEALRESEERLSSFLDHSPSAIFLKDLQGRYILVNRVLAERHRRPQQEIIGMTSHDLLPRDAAEKFVAQDREVLHTGGVAQWEHEFPLPDGTHHTVINTKFPVMDGEGRIMGVGTISTDVTEQRMLEQHLRESQKMEAVGQLAGGIAHEFNNMLQVVINSAQFLKIELEGSGEKGHLVDIILQASNRSANLTRQLLTFSRKSVIQPESLDLAALISSEMAMLGQVIGENIRIELQTTENLWAVKADPGMMEQIILNLCINARDAMRDGGRIVIGTENLSAGEEFCARHGLNEPGDYVIVTVSDDGAGMAPDVLERVFEPFFTTKEVGQGTGLGLAMVKGAIQQHDGTINVSSKLGSGTTFTIYLSRSDAPKAASKPPPAHIAGGNELILLAEDEEDVLDILTQSLHSKGYEVVTAKDGAEALTAFKDNAERIHLVILDMVMPNMSGREVYEKLRAMGSDVPILFSSGYAPDEDDFAFLNENRIPLIQKPYTLNDIFSAVREALDGKRSAR